MYAFRPQPTVGQHSLIDLPPDRSLALVERPGHGADGEQLGVLEPAFTVRDGGPTACARVVTPALVSSFLVPERHDRHRRVDHGLGPFDVRRRWNVGSDRTQPAWNWATVCWCGSNDVVVHELTVPTIDWDPVSEGAPYSLRVTHCAELHAQDVVLCPRTSCSLERSDEQP